VLLESTVQAARDSPPETRAGRQRARRMAWRRRWQRWWRRMTGGG
jgi:hypothetical protein